MHDVSGRKLEEGKRLEAVEIHFGGGNIHTNNYRRRPGLVP
jgi:hypothetical protein